MNAHTIRDRAGNAVQSRTKGPMFTSERIPNPGRERDISTLPQFAEEYQRPEMLAEEVKAQAYLDLAIRTLVYLAISTVVVFGGLAILTAWEMI